MRRHKKKTSNVLPLGIKNRVKTELPALVALSAIGEPWLCPQHVHDLLAVALVVREMAPEDSLQATCAMELERLCNLEEITAAHKLEFALNLAECLPWLQLQANHRVSQAINTVSMRYNNTLAA